jgi:glycosyltransferase involved in cell wall biosynthesis
MKVLIVTDAWEPQVNGVVRTLKQTAIELGRIGHTVSFLTPQGFRSMPCPTYPEIRLTLFARERVARQIDDQAPDALHIATEGPLGLAARAHALRRRLPFTTAYHTRFPEYVHARFRVPLSVTYRYLRHFHGPSSAVMAPTPTIVNDLKQWGFGNAVLWSRGVDLEVFNPAGDRAEPQASSAVRPVFLCVGRVAVEKNLETFLALDLPGEKWVAGEGPQREKLLRRFPEARWFGVLAQNELAALYRSADVFVLPSLTDTFGLVQLEAMACGVPVAALPFGGPIDVVGDGGLLHNNLREACLGALAIPRTRARTRAEGFSWRDCSMQFLNHLQPIAWREAA